MSDGCSQFYFSQLELLRSFRDEKILDQMTRGIEKENLRVNEAGVPVNTPHPQSLGSSLMNPMVTTDFSENMIECITAPVSGSYGRKKLFRQLAEITDFIMNALSQQPEKEFLWPYSMPYLPDQQAVESIDLAQYGRSYDGLIKTLYRRGLALRYGKSMQSIAGLHYNFSFPEKLLHSLGPLNNKENDSQLTPSQRLVSARYMGVIRNTMKYAWVIDCLFGASPVCYPGSLLDENYQVRENDLGFDSKSDVLVSSKVASLRLSDIGYCVKNQLHFDVKYHSVNDYVEKMVKIIQSESSEYKKIPIKDAQGNHQQLSQNNLQNESEFYSAIRPKVIINKDGMSLHQLKHQGVSYLEYRGLDLMPTMALGIAEETSIFLDLFFMQMLLEDSQCEEEGVSLPLLSHTDHVFLIDAKGHRVLQPKHQVKAIDFLESMSDLACIMDECEAGEGNQYQKALSEQLKKLTHHNLLPSNQVIDQWNSASMTFRQYMASIMIGQRETLTKQYADIGNNEAFYKQQARDSLSNQRMKEKKEEDADFDTYLKNYVSTIVKY